MLKILGQSAGDRSAWLEAWRRTGGEPFAHPDYLAIVAPGYSSSHCALFQRPGCEVLLPFHRRSISREVWPSAGSKTCDAISPYGYGGPYSANGRVPDDFWAAFIAWMRTEHVISFFGRASLEARLESMQGIHGIKTVGVAQNIVVALDREPEDQWRHYDHKVRKNVNKARRAGLVVEVQAGSFDIEEFLDLYQETMDRRGAGPWYYFSKEFFDRLAVDLAGSFVTAHVRDSTGRLVSTEIVLESERHLYSFLGGTRSEAFAHAPNDLLKHAVIEYGHEHHKVSYVLGGGYMRNDGIFRYKKSFDPDGIREFQGIHIVADTKTYESLVHDQKSRMLSANPQSVIDSQFFPEYRASIQSPTVPQFPAANTT